MPGHSPGHSPGLAPCGSVWLRVALSESAHLEGKGRTWAEARRGGISCCSMEWLIGSGFNKTGVSVHFLSDFDIADARRLQMVDWFIFALLP